jgi:hypothetical protein
MALLPAGYANAVPSPLTVSISGLDPNKINLVSAVLNHVRVFLPKSEWATCDGGEQRQEVLPLLDGCERCARFISHLSSHGPA